MEKKPNGAHKKAVKTDAKYNEKLAINGSFEDVIRLSVGKSAKKTKAAIAKK